MMYAGVLLYPFGRDLIPHDNHHEQKHQKNELAVRRPMHHILHKQSAWFISLRSVPLSERPHTVSVWKIRSDIHNDDIARFHDSKDKDRYPGISVAPACTADFLP